MTKILIPFRRFSFLQCAGFTLIEVLVALFVLALGLLGLAVLQTTGLRFNTNSYSRTQATFLAYDIIEKMRSNVNAFTGGGYDVPDTSSANSIVGSASYTCNTSQNCACDTGNCDSDALAQYDLGQWYYRQDTLLTGARDSATLPTPQRATIVRNGNEVTVTMFWLEQESNSTTATPRQQAWHVEIYPL